MADRQTSMFKRMGQKSFTEKYSMRDNVKITRKQFSLSQSFKVKTNYIVLLYYGSRAGWKESG